MYFYSNYIQIFCTLDSLSFTNYTFLSYLIIWSYKETGALINGFKFNFLKNIPIRDPNIIIVSNTIRRTIEVIALELGVSI